MDIRAAVAESISLIVLTKPVSCVELGSGAGSGGGASAGGAVVTADSADADVCCAVAATVGLSELAGTACVVDFGVTAVADLGLAAPLADVLTGVSAGGGAVAGAEQAVRASAVMTNATSTTAARPAVVSRWVRSARCTGQPSHFRSRTARIRGSAVCPGGDRAITTD